MNANQIERAAYIAAHAILVADLGAANLACPGARRSRAVDRIAEIIRNIFEIHSNDWWERAEAPKIIRPVASRNRKILQLRAETAAPISISPATGG
jgi:hypothetical protein